MWFIATVVLPVTIWFITFTVKFQINQQEVQALKVETADIRKLQQDFQLRILDKLEKLQSDISFVKGQTSTMRREVKEAVNANSQ